MLVDLAMTSTPQQSREHRRSAVGAPPGTLVDDPAAPEPTVHVFAYGPDHVEEITVKAGELGLLVDARKAKDTHEVL